MFQHFLMRPDQNVTMLSTIRQQGTAAEQRCSVDFFYLRTETQAYITKEIGKTIQLLPDEKWGTVLAFFTNITACLHELCVETSRKTYITMRSSVY